MLRRIAEIVFGPITVYRKLPAFVGSGIVVASPNAGGLRYLFRSSSSLDPVLLRAASALVRLGDVVWDVGGNVGLFAAAAAGLAGKDAGVYAIEPDKDAYAYLNRTARALLAEAPMQPLPREIIERPKTGFGIPVGRWLADRAGQAGAAFDSRSWAREVVAAMEKGT